MPKAKASLLVIASTLLTVAVLFLLPFTPSVKVRTAVIEEGDLIRTTLLEGVVGYRDEQACLNISEGKVMNVYVKEGQAVKKGDLLIRMDTEAQEVALAAMSKALNERDELLSTLDDTARAAVMITVDQVNEIQKKTELEAVISGGQIRAAFDGVVGGIYTQEGSYVSAMSVLGTVHGTEKSVTAMGRASDLDGVATGDLSAVCSSQGESLGTARLNDISAPALNDTTGQLMQTLSFDLLQETDLRIGERVMVEVVCEKGEGLALLPLNAVDSSMRVWVVENGTASPVKVDVSLRNDQYAAVSDELKGKQVVLFPDEKALYQGCPVKEAGEK